MYLQHFGFERLPFEALSNGSLYVDLAEHREALQTVLFGLGSGEGFVKIVGEVGTGKTALCRNLLARLDEEFVTVYLPNPVMRPNDLLHAIADELGAPLPAQASVHDLQKATRAKLLEIARDGGRVAVFVDEAQTMPPNTLEELRLLSNLESNQGKLVQVVLFGQPELDERLADYSMRQLQQRIAFSARLSPLDRKACRVYVHRRLVHAGATARPIFTPAAIDRVHASSGGIPRLINTLCHKSLIAAWSDGDFQVGRRHVSRAVEDTEGIRRWSTRPLFSRRKLRRVPSSRPPSDWSQLPR